MHRFKIIITKVIKRDTVGDLSETSTTVAVNKSKFFVMFCIRILMLNSSSMSRFRRRESFNGF
jgi:hypothetical protein